MHVAHPDQTASLQDLRLAYCATFVKPHLTTENSFKARSIIRESHVLGCGFELTQAHSRLGCEHFYRVAREFNREEMEHGLLVITMDRTSI